MSQLPPFKGNNQEETDAWLAMAEKKTEMKFKMVKKMHEVFFPTKDWNDLTDAQYEMLTHYANVVMFETTDTCRLESQDPTKFV